MNREEIKKILPHREPMLLLDEAWQSGGSYTVRGDEFFLQGHYPGNPVVPGVILCEIMAQSACLTLGEKIIGATPYFTGLENIRIRKAVRPGDKLVTEVAIMKEKDPFYFVEAKGFVNGGLCVSGSLLFHVARL